MAKEKFSVILLAAGKGLRMKHTAKKQFTDVPEKGLRMNLTTKKQFIEVHGRPLLYYPLLAFEKSDVEEIIIVTGKEDISFVQEEIVHRFSFQKVSHIVPGGEERYLSVFEGLKWVKNPYVLVHDGVRVCVTEEIIHRTMDATVQYKACEVAIPSVDTVKIADSDGFVAMTPERETVWAIQTPQGFLTDILRSSYEKIFAEHNTKGITDDAMVVERGNPSCKIWLVQGEDTNIKVTTEKDLKIVEEFLRKI